MQQGENLNNETYDLLKKSVKAAALVTELEWPKVVEAADVEQEIWLKLLESPNSATKLGEMGESSRKKSLLRMGKQIAAEASATFELFSCQIFYSTDDVRDMLEAGALVGEGFNSEDERIDFESAIGMVRDANSQYLDYMWGYYELGDFPLDSATNRKRLSRAVRFLADQMNNTTKGRRETYGGPGSRKAISNSRAMAASSTTWDGPKIA